MLVIYFVLPRWCHGLSEGHGLQDEERIAVGAAQHLTGDGNGEAAWKCSLNGGLMGFNGGFVGFNGGLIWFNAI